MGKNKLLLFLKKNCIISLVNERRYFLEECQLTYLDGMTEFGKPPFCNHLSRHWLGLGTGQL